MPDPSGSTPRPTKPLASPTSLARLAVLLSGSGRTLQNLIEVIAKGRLNAQIVLVIASRECVGAERARAAGLDTRIIRGEIPAADLENLMSSARADLIVCAGYLKYVHVPPAFAGRIVNIHPSLLPKHGGPGMFGDRVHAAVLAAGDTLSGCTVHLVDEVYDHGQILLQRTCPVLTTDDVHTLADRVFEQECIAYPEALRCLIESRAPAEP